jgi:hypothetical protein
MKSASFYRETSIETLWHEWRSMELTKLKCRRGCSDPNRILAPLLAPGSAISAAPGLDVPSVSQKRRFT